jgi:crossover junction endodeoxyribonuclease RuvC
MAEPWLIVGLDPSLTSFGCAAVKGPGVVPVLTRIRPGTMTGHLRLRYLMREVETFVKGCDLVVIEGVAFTGNNPGTYASLAGLFTLITHGLWEQGYPYAVVTPSTRCKYLTGKGNASKDDCLLAASRRFDRVVEVSGNDTADALTLAQMGAHHYGCQVVNMPKDSTDLLTAKNKKGQPVIDWPVLKRRGLI